MDTKVNEYIATYIKDESCISHKINLDSKSFITKETKYYSNGIEKEISRYEDLICNIRTRFDENGECIHTYVYDPSMPKPFEFDVMARKHTPVIELEKSRTYLYKVK